MNDKPGIFNFDVRVVTCKNCGAPLRAEIASGVVTCEYCGVVNRLTGRDGACFVPTTLPESERIAALRLATGNEVPMPAMDFVQDGKVPFFFSIAPSRVDFSLINRPIPNRPLRIAPSRVDFQSPPRLIFR